MSILFLQFFYEKILVSTCENLDNLILILLLHLPLTLNIQHEVEAQWSAKKFLSPSLQVCPPSFSAWCSFLETPWGFYFTAYPMSHPTIGTNITSLKDICLFPYAEESSCTTSFRILIQYLLPHFGLLTHSHQTVRSSENSQTSAWFMSSRDGAWNIVIFSKCFRIKVSSLKYDFVLLIICHLQIPWKSYLAYSSKHLILLCIC